MIGIGCIGRCSSDKPGMKARNMNNGNRRGRGVFTPRYHHIIIFSRSSPAPKPNKMAFAWTGSSTRAS